MKSGIQSIQFVTGLGSTPARVNRVTGDLYLNAEKWDAITPERKLFILLHEAGHVSQQTRNEEKADQWAFKAFMNSGSHSLLEAVKALSRVLHFENPGHIERLKRQVIRAFEYDFYINGNEKANPEELNKFLDQMDQTSQYSDFSFSKTAAKLFIPRKKRAKIRAKKAQKKTTKVQKAAPVPIEKEAAAPVEQSTTQTTGRRDVPKILYVAIAALVAIIVIYFVVRKNHK